MWKFEISNDWEEIKSDAYQKRWLRLLDVSPNPHVFFHPSLIKVWVTTYLPIRKFSLIFIWGKESKTGNEVFFPLVLWQKNWKNAFLRTIVPAGYSDFDYHDPIFSKTITHPEIQIFYEQLLSLLNENYRYNTIVFDGLHENCIPNQFKISHKEPCPFIPIFEYQSFDEYLETRNKKFRQNYLRRKSNLESDESLEYICCKDMEAFAKIKHTIPDMLKIHSERWPKAYKAQGFHECLIEEGLSAGILHLYIIKTTEKVVSWRITFLYKDKLYLYMPTVNPYYSSYSPGTLSLAYCIENAIDTNLNLVDQLRGAELYKSEWTSDYEMIYNVELENKSIISKLKKIFLQIKGKKWK